MLMFHSHSHTNNLLSIYYDEKVSGHMMINGNDIIDERLRALQVIIK
jgi:hypothetical protein